MSRARSEGSGRYRDENRRLLLDHLLHHPCVDCGEKDPVVLEFDHRDRATKHWTVTGLALHKPWRRVLAEMAKCDVRCAACHRRRTATQFGWSKARPAEFEAANESPVDQAIRVRALEPDFDGDRICNVCLTKKTAAEFPYRSATKGTRQRRCKACVASNSRKHYQDHRAEYIARTRARTSRERVSLKARLMAYLRTHPCSDCGETDPLLLEFDHRDGAEKIACVGALARGQNWRAVADEIAKCDVRCVNCHRRRTARQFGWSRLTRRETGSPRQDAPESEVVDQADHRVMAPGDVVTALD